MVKESQLKKGIVQTAFLMAILTLGSKILGFLRELAMATFFGTSYIVDAYVMAQAVPGIIFNGFIAAIAIAYMPLLSEKIEKEGTASGDRLTSQVIRILMVFSITVSIVGIVFSEEIVSIFAPGFIEETAALTSFFLKVTFSYVIFSSVARILEHYMQYKSTFIPSQVLISG